MEEDKPKLPANWALTTIGGAYDVIGGGTPSTTNRSFWGGSTPWITSADILGVRAIDISRYVTLEGIESSTTNLVPERTLLVVTRVGLGKIAIADQPICFSQDLQGLVQNPKLILPEFSLYYLSFELQRLKFEGRGTTISGLTKKQIKDNNFPLPPLNEQRRIVAKIEELFLELDKGVESLKTARAQLKTYRQAVLKHAATGQLLVDIGHRKSIFGEKELTKLSKVVRDLGQGWSPRCLNQPSQSEDVWGVIKTTAIQHLFFNEEENKQLPDQLEPRPHLTIKSGEILVTRAGPRKRVGVACLVKSCRSKLMLCDKAYRLQVDDEKMLPEYLEMLLNSPSVMHDVEKLKTGINDSGVNLTQKRFLELEIFAPKIKEQQQTLSELESLLSNIENVEKQIAAGLKKSDALRQSILKKAFSGKLVPQDSSDEPASILLERIRAEKAAQQTTKAKAKKKPERKTAT